LPTLYTKDGASAVFDSPEEVKAALASGEWSLPEGQTTVEYTTPLSGRSASMTPEAFELTPGHENYGVESANAGFDKSLQAAEHAQYSGIGQQLIAAGEGAGSVLSFGLSDLALDAAGADTKYRAEHAVGRTVGEIGAMAALALGTGGEGLLAKGLGASPAGVVSKIAGAGKTALGRVALAAGEGAAYGVGQAVSKVALAEPGVTAEQVVSELGQGALLGAALGGAGGALGEGFRVVGAARSARARAALDFESGTAKEALGTMAASHKAIDDMVEYAQAEGRAAANEVRESIRAQQRAGMAGVVDPAVAKAMEVEFAASIQDAVKTVRPPRLDPSHGRAVFDLLPDEAVTPAAFKRLLKKDPEELVKRATALDDYYAAAQHATKGNEVARTRVAEAIAEHKAALDALVPAEAQSMLSDPKVLGAALGVETGLEMLPDDTPGKRLLQLAAAYKLVGGIAGVRGASRGLGARIANAIGKRASAGAFSGMARMIPAVKNAGPVLGTAAVGAAASTGYEAYGVMQRWLSGRGVKAAMTSDAQVSAAITASVNKVAAGTPSKRARGMPGLNVVLDKLLGDPDEAAKKSPQEKFKVVQERLAKATVAPEAVLDGVYELLRPLQSVSEQIADMAESVLGVQLQYLASVMPRDPGTNMVFGKSMWAPTDRELYEFSQHAAGVLYPLDTIEAISDGLVPPQAAEAVAATNPELFMKFQRSLMERADEIRDNSTLSQRIALGLAFKVSIEPTADPRYVAFVQDMHARKTMEQAAGKAAEGSTPEESYSEAQKLL
jgi:hypothetical protein